MTAPSPATRLTGIGTLIGLDLRTDRIRLAVWVIVLSALVAIAPFTLHALTLDEAANQGVSPQTVLAQQAELANNNASLVALRGPAHDLDTYGGRYEFESGAAWFALVGLMNVMLVARHTRTEEETGRAELIRSARVGRWAPIGAVLVVSVLANTVIAVLAATSFALNEADGAGAYVFGASVVGCGMVFAAIGLVWMQVFTFARTAIGASVATIAFSVVIRAVGDVRDNWLVWLSPIGWVQAARPFGPTNAVSFVALGAATVIGIMAAGWLATRRDVGSGLVAPRPGPAHAGARLATAPGLAWRLNRGIVAGWALGVAAISMAYGSVISSFDDFLEQSEGLGEILAQAGVDLDDLRNGMITMLLTIIAAIACGGCLQLAMRPRKEEDEGRAEPILATRVSRRRWLTSYVSLSLLFAPVAMVIAALGLYSVDALMVGHYDDLGGGVVAALARVPALWALSGLAVLAYGLARRYSVAAWVAYGGALILFLFGAALRLPQWVVDLSPFVHVAHLPGADQGIVAIMVLVAIAAAATIGGVVAFARRDIG